MKELDQIYAKFEEPTQGCLLALRDYILSLDDNINHVKKYGMPFFTYKKKMLCYFWFDKKTGLPYIGIADGFKIDHPSLEQGNRSRMKIFRIDPKEDLPINTLNEVFELAINLQL